MIHIALLLAAAAAEAEVHFDAAGFDHGATLTIPADEGRHPAILMFAGSGPTDRNGESPMLPGANGSARLLAAALAERGVVTLRFDKFGTGATGIPDSIGWDEWLAEIDAARTLLAARPEVDADRLVLLGHSEGGTHALRWCSDESRPRFAGLILMASPGRLPADVMVAQVDARLAEAGLAGDARADQSRRLREAMNALRDGEEVDPAAASDFPGVQQLVAALAVTRVRPWVREYLAFDPADAASRVPVPVLVLQGERDIQVSVEDARLQWACIEGRDERSRLLLLPDADHVFKHDDRAMEDLGGLAALEYNLEDRVLADGLVDAIAEWVESVR